jgi:hypothetical protein
LAAGEVVEDDGVRRADLCVGPVDSKRPLVLPQIREKLSEPGEDFGVGGMSGQNGLVELDLELVLRAGEKGFQVVGSSDGTGGSRRVLGIARHGSNSLEGKCSRLDTIEIGCECETKCLGQRTALKVREFTPSTRHYRHKPIRNNALYEGRFRTLREETPQGKNVR